MNTQQRNCSLVIMLRNDPIQYSMEETATWRHPDLKSLCDNLKNYCIIMKLSWFKNVKESRDAPNQILLGSMDCRYCTLSHLGAWLEYHYMQNPEENEFILGHEGADNPISINCSASHQLSILLNKQADIHDAIVDGLTGSHSN